MQPKRAKDMGTTGNSGRSHPALSFLSVLLLVALVAAGGEAPAAAVAGSDEVAALTEAQGAAKAAHDRRDYAAYRAQVLRLYELTSGESDTVFAMAKAEALLGHAAAALDWLNAYAAMGLVHDAAAAPDLASLKGNPGFAKALARLEANKQPISHATRAFVLPERELLSEDIAYDPAAHRFLVSSIRQAKIVAIDARSGAMTDFAPTGRDAVWGILALAMDAPRGVLWATTAAMPQVLGYRAADGAHTAVLRYDLATGKLLQRYDLPHAAAKPIPASAAASGPAAGVGAATGAAGADAGTAAAPGKPAASGTPSAPEAPASIAAPTSPAAVGTGGGATAGAGEPEEDPVLGDMTVASNGDVFASEGIKGAVYVLRHGKAELETLVAPGVLLSPQTPVAMPDGRYLLVADYVRGIAVVDRATGVLRWLEHPREVAVNGIDGLYLSGRSLLAVQNGIEPNRIIRLRLDPTLSRIVSGEILESSSPGLGAPTHGTIVDGKFYFLANSGWDQLTDEGSIKPGGAFTSPMIWRVAL